MKRILFVATKDFHFDRFHLPIFKWFKEQGWEVHVAADGEMELPFLDGRYHLPFHRSPFRLQNMEVYRRLKEIMERHRFDLIHCHTPMGGVLGRLSGRTIRRTGSRILYTAHGFHFCRGAPLANWILYYPIEKWLCRLTDCLITINHEDYRLAKNRNFKPGHLERVHGVGVDMEKFRPTDPQRKGELKRLAGYDERDILMLYAAEFNKNKNQQILIRALASIREEAPRVKLLLAGDGPNLAHAMELAARLGLEDRVKFLGFRRDIDKLLNMSDIAVSGSIREGLPVNIMEAMACGLPVIASINRGHNELIEDSVNGYLIPVHDGLGFARKMLVLSRSEELRRQFGAINRLKAEQYSTSRVLNEMSDIYKKNMTEAVNEPENQYRRAYL